MINVYVSENKALREEVKVLTARLEKSEAEKKELREKIESLHCALIKMSVDAAELGKKIRNYELIKKIESTNSIHDDVELVFIRYQGGESLAEALENVNRRRRGLHE